MVDCLNFNTQKTALITGASGGIGRALSMKLAAQGFDIAAGYAKNLAAAENLCRKIQDSCGRSATPVHIDLGDIAGLASAAEKVRQIFGTPYAIINNGGCEAVGLFQDMSDERLVEVMNTDLVGAMVLTKHFLPDMLRRHSGRIVNISSVWGEVGASCETAYSAAKAGLIGFTKALGKECAPSGITVNAICPGFIDTKMNSHLSCGERTRLIDSIPASRAGTPEDIAAAAAFLISEDAAYICGQTLRVDGGWI